MTKHLYGVFLRPDPATAVAITDVTFQVKRQFGFVSAGAFPPHATLAGSVPSRASTAEVVRLLDPVISAYATFPLHNSGIAKHNTAIVYDVDLRADGSRNETLHSLAVDINESMATVAESTEGFLVKPFAPERFRAHFSLASHELQVRPDLSAEVEAFIRALPYTPTEDFLADTVTLYRFRSDNWAGHWWEDLTWEQLHTWTLKEP